MVTSRLFRSVAPSIVFLVVVMASCKEAKITETPVAVASIDVNPATVSLLVGEIAQVTATPKSSSGELMTGRSVQWQSLDQNIATVANGLITARGPGNTTVRVTSGSASRDIATSVTALPRINLNVSTISFVGLTGTANPAAQNVSISNGGGGVLSGLTVAGIQYNSGPASGWLAAALSTSTAPSTLSLQASLSGLAAGTYEATVSIASTNATNSPQTVRVTFVVTQSFTVTVSGGGAGNGVVSGNGINCTINSGAPTGTCTVRLASGTAIALTATPTGTHVFNGWSGACTGTAACSFSLTADRLVTASFNPPGFILTILAAGNGSGTVTGGAINCTITNGAAASGCATTLPPNTAVTLTALASVGHTFGGWTGSCSGSSNVCNLTMTADQTVTANFTAIPPRIGLTPSGVTFTADQGAASPPAQQVSVSNTGGGSLTGLSVGTITYTGGPVGWLSSVNLSSASATATLTLQANTTGLAPGNYTATVQVLSPVASNSPQNLVVSLIIRAIYTLQIQGAGAGNGTVSGPGNINCTITNGVASGPLCSANFVSGSTFNLAATAPFGNSWTSWSGGCSGSTSTTGNVVMTSNRVCTVTFSRNAPVVTTGSSGNITTTTAEIGGIVTEDGRPYTIWFEYGTSSTLATFIMTGSAPGPACGTVPCDQGWGIPLSGLTPATTYYYRIVAQNAVGTTKGSILSFRTN